MQIENHAGNITIGVIGDKSSKESSGSILTALGLPEHIKIQYSFLQNKCTGVRIGGRNATVIDIECAPKYQSNAINAIADCDVVIYVVSWIKSDDEESERLMQRYLEIAHVFRVKHFIVAITKIDYNSTPFITEKIFKRATNRVKDIMNRTNIEEYDIVPVAKESADIEFITNCPSMKWCDGPTLTEKLSDIKPSREYKEDPFLLTVTHFYKNGGVIIGIVRRGMVSAGDRIKLFPSGIKAQINSIHIHSDSFDTAHCGDRIGMKLKMKNGIKLSIKRGDIMRIDENPDERERLEDIVLRFQAKIYVHSSNKLKKLMIPQENSCRVEPKYRWDLYSVQNLFNTSVFIGNSTTKCCVRSIKWKRNADGKQIDYPQYLEHGDTASVVVEVLKPIHVTPYNEYPEFGAVVMVHADLLCTGKVTKIMEHIPMQSTYPHISRFGQVNSPKKMSRILQMIEESLKFVQWQQDNGSTTPCDCITELEKLRDLVRDGFSILSPFRHLNWDWYGTNLCMVQPGDVDTDVALKCGSNLNRDHELATALCNQMGRMLKRLPVIPMEVIQIITAYSRRGKRAFSCEYDYSIWKPIEEFGALDICKVITVRCGQRACCRLYLLENGNLWVQHKQYRLWTEPPKITFQRVRYFGENGIVIRDVAIGRSSDVYRFLAVDADHRVYSCEVGLNGNVETPVMIHFGFSNDETVQKCVAVKCGWDICYVRFKVKKVGEKGSEQVVDRHFMFGKNQWRLNRCFTFDGKNEVRTPFCINETVDAHYGGESREIDDVVVETIRLKGHYMMGWNKDRSYVVLNHYYQKA